MKLGLLCIKSHEAILLICLTWAAISAPSSSGRAAGFKTAKPTRRGTPPPRSQQITFSNRCWDSGVCWAPDGKSLLFHRLLWKEPQWFRANIHIIVNNGIDTISSLLEDGEAQLVGICRVNLRTKKVRKLGCLGINPQHSPDGRFIQFFTPTWGLAVARPDGKSGRVLLKDNLKNRCDDAVWSPDSRKVCCAAAGYDLGYRIVDVYTGQKSWLRPPKEGFFRKELPIVESMKGVDDEKYVCVGSDNIVAHPDDLLPNGLARRAAWSNDGKLIVFPQSIVYKNTHDFFIWDRLWKAKPDGSKASLVIKPGNERYAWMAIRGLRWSSDGRRLYFLRKAQWEGPYLSSVDLRTGTVRPTGIKAVRSYDLRKGEGFLTYCYDGEWEGQPNDYRVYLSRVPNWGSIVHSSKLQAKKKLYQTYLASGAGPVWSPSGDRIAFVRDGHIFVIKVPQKYLQ